MNCGERNASQGRKIVLFSSVGGTSGYQEPPYMPLSLLAVGSALQTQGCEVTIIDGQVMPGWRDRLKAEIENAAFLGVSALTGPSITPVLEAIGIARSVRDEMPIVWGGYHATLAYRSILLEGLVDYVVLGPGESAAVALLERLVKGVDRSPLRQDISVPNVAHLYEGNVRVERGATAGRKAQDLPPPMDYELIDVPAYFSATVRTLHYISSYGCPHACAFCAEPEYSKRVWKPLPPERVVTELHALWRRYKPDRFGIMDPNFSSSIQRVCDIAEGLKRLGGPFEICCDMRATDILRLSRVADLKDLRSAGFAEIYVGVESGSDRQLRALRKSMTANEAFEACRLLAHAGIRTITSFMHDLPGETADDSAATMSLARRLASLWGNEQRHHFFTPYPSTEIFRSIDRSDPIMSKTRQSDWANTSTYGASQVWPGRTDFRRLCLAQLEEIRSGLRDPTRLTLPSVILAA